MVFVFSSTTKGRTSSLVSSSSYCQLVLLFVVTVVFGLSSSSHVSYVHGMVSLSRPVAVPKTTTTTTTPNGFNTDEDLHNHDDMFCQVSTKTKDSDDGDDNINDDDVTVLKVKSMTQKCPIEGTNLVDVYIAIDDSSSSSSSSTTTLQQQKQQQQQQSTKLTSSSRPGNGGIRLLKYKSSTAAIEDSVRLATGMTKKHDMYRTGFSGAKIVVNSKVDIDTNVNNNDDCDDDRRDGTTFVVCRKTLMDDIGKALNVLDGQMYTGCDLNTSDEDMDHLVKATNDKYVLAGRKSRVDTNVATASSVIGSILGAIDAATSATTNDPKDGDDQSNSGSLVRLSELTFTVQGCGKVGRTVAEQLVKLGAKCVQTCDLIPEAANIDGCTPIDDWTSTPCDFLVPCANSLAITPEVATHFPQSVKFCVGATNSPYENPTARQIFDERGVMHIPESISSAGAILADSVEVRDFVAVAVVLF